MEQTISRKEMLKQAIKSALKGKMALSLSNLPCKCVEITGKIQFTSHTPDTCDCTVIDQWTEVKGITTATILYHSDIYVPSVEIEFMAQISDCTIVSIREPIRALIDIPVVL
ncbi:MAG: hypothetical protein H9802_01840 [Candidatus Phocaeicola faecipullorum]|nr:hypothetical protein [Candidatus Phocaeicola faecipullorum]